MPTSVRSRCQWPPFTAQSRDAAPHLLAAIGFNLTRAIGALAGGEHATATTATLRTRLIVVAARTTRSAGHTNWPWANAFTRAFTASIGPPIAA